METLESILVKLIIKNIDASWKCDGNSNGVIQAVLEIKQLLKKKMPKQEDIGSEYYLGYNETVNKVNKILDDL